ncbi:MAG: threonine synthase [Synergistaceae bacterium]|nr:threonine synthase [Synergistaceae bacterium]
MFRCSSCGKTEDERSLLWRCSCGGYFDLEPGERAPLTRRAILPGEPGMWRYAPSLPPVPSGKRVTLGEGWTPLSAEPGSFPELYFKVDYAMPTGSYKDRGMACLVSRLLSLGVKEVIEDSSGNAGASMAAYCARAGIRCRVFVPDYTSEGTCLQILASGAVLERISGTREDTARAAEAAGEGGFYASHNWSPWFAHGVKTFAFEIWEQLGFRAPGAVLLPAGQGSLVLGCALAFDELLASGEISSLPRIYALQPERCDPLARAFRQGVPLPVPVEKGETAAEGISAAYPVRGKAVLAAVRKSGGEILSFSEAEIWKGFLSLARRGYYVEPTSAIVAAGMERLCARGAFSSGEAVVGLLSGSGLKAGDKILSHFSGSSFTPEEELSPFMGEPGSPPWEG